MKWLLYVLIVFLLGNCSIQRKCRRCALKCPVIEIIKDSVVYKEKVQYRDTIILYTLPTDTIWQNKLKYVYLSKGLIFSDTSFVQNTYCTSKAWVFDSKLNHFITIKDTTIQLRLDSALQKSEYWYNKYYYKQDVNKIIERYIPKFYKFTFWFFWLVVAFVLGYFAYNWKRFFR